ncbi:MAG: hypothetical protein ABIA62_05975 [Candidatus Woesearchaeota archaeon]
MVKRANPELVKYIEKHLSKGFKIEHVKKRLAEVGHPIEAIEDAAAFVLMTKQSPKKRPKTFMIVYGLILISVIIVFIGFIWLKAGQQAEYKEAVEEVKKNQSYMGRTDVELLKLAASTGNLEACRFISDENLFFACDEKYWERTDCSYEATIGEGVNECRVKLSVGEDFYNKYCEGETVESLCISSAALIEKDVTMCPDDICIQQLAIQENDKYICHTIEDKDQTKDCLFEFALATGSADVCLETDYPLICNQLLWSDEQKKTHILESVSVFNKNQRTRTATQSELDALFRDVRKFYVDGICDEIEGAYTKYSLKDLCILNRALSSLLDRPVLDGLAEEEKEIVTGEYRDISETNLLKCKSILDPEILWCCINTQDEEFINRCRFFNVEDVP